MRRLLLIAFLAAMCLGLGLVLSYGIEDSKPKPVPPQSPEIWKDPQSGLTWQVSPNPKQKVHLMMDWRLAERFCKRLKLGGQRHWRLPTITELRSLIRDCPATQTGGSCGVTDICLKFKKCRDVTCGGCSKKGGPGSGGSYWPPELSGEIGRYWSSSTVWDASTGFEKWTVNFDNGDIGMGELGYSNVGVSAIAYFAYVRCVHQ